jgi:hypothetical protein
VIISPPVSKGRRALNTMEERYQRHRGNASDNHSNGASSPGVDLSRTHFFFALRCAFRQAVLTDHWPVFKVLNHVEDFGTAHLAGSNYIELRSPLPGELAESEDDLSSRTDGHPSLKQEGSRRVTVSKLEETPFYRKHSFLIGLALALVIGISLLFLLLYPVVGAIIQHVVNASRLNVDRVAIAEPTNTS